MLDTDGLNSETRNGDKLFGLKLNGLGLPNLNSSRGAKGWVYNSSALDLKTRDGMTALKQAEASGDREV